MSIKFNNSEIKGTVILAFIILLFVSTKHFYFKLANKNNKIHFDDKTLQDKFKTFVEENKLDVNILTEADLLDLGLYKNTATNILKYREALGGFISFEQLKEIKNINESTLKILEEYSVIDKNFIPKKLKINTAEFKTLLSHPYLDYENVKTICNFRRYEKIINIDVLLKQKLIDQETIKKMKPYFDFS